MSLLPSPIEHLVAWGQYMHWAELQFLRYRQQNADSSAAALVGAVAHWLAAEYVVVEGWIDLNLSNSRVSLLLNAYPEHKDLLRRCRNAVYHFQKTPLDPRITRVLDDKNEELRWSVALHFELQGVLIELADQLRMKGTIGCEVLDGMERAIGWYPRYPIAESMEELQALCAELNSIDESDLSPEAIDARRFVATAKEKLQEIGFFPLTAKLSRMGKLYEPRSHGGQCR